MDYSDYFAMFFVLLLLVMVMFIPMYDYFVTTDLHCEPIEVSYCKVIESSNKIKYTLEDSDRDYFVNYDEWYSIEKVQDGILFDYLFRGGK